MVIENKDGSLTMSCADCWHVSKKPIAGLMVLTVGAMFCMRYPPETILAPGPGGQGVQAVTCFPVVSAEMICGEFRPTGDVARKFAIRE